MNGKTASSRLLARAAIAAVATLPALTGCGDANPAPVTGPPAIQEIVVGVPLPLLQVGDTVRASAVARNAQGTVVEGAIFTWSSTDTLVARVDASGLLRALSPGPATIRASASGRSGGAEVVVSPAASPPPPVPGLVGLLPAQVLERSGELDLLLEGTDFRPASRVLWNEIPLATTFLSETRLVARIPGAFVGQPLEAGISVETVTSHGAGSSPRSGLRSFHVLPRPLASVQLETSGNHVFPGQVLEIDVVLRNDLGEVVSRPGLNLVSADEAVLGHDWMGNLVGRAPGTTTLRAEVGALSSEAVVSVGPAPVRRLVVVARPQGVPELFLLDFGEPGSQPPRFVRILPAGTRAAEPSVSPDGARLAFAGTATDGSVDIWTVAMDGSDLRRLTHEGFRADQPAWSPDGSRIAFRAFRRGIPEIWIMNADGSAPHPLLAAPTMIPEEESHFPAWLPDGETVVFSRGFGAERALHLARLPRTAPGQPAQAASELLRIPGFHADRPAPRPQGGTLALEARSRTTGEVRILLASVETGALLHPLNPPATGVARPALPGGDWLAAIGPGPLQAHRAPTLRIQELNGTRVSFPIPSWIGRIEEVAVGR